LDHLQNPLGTSGDSKLPFTTKFVFDAPTLTARNAIAMARIRDPNFFIFQSPFMVYDETKG
jgi:hypothetical protein